MKSLKFVALGLVLALAGAACSSDSSTEGTGSPSPTPTSSAMMGDATSVKGTTANEWMPADVTIGVGGTVDWTWEGFHNVAFGDDGPRSGEPADGGAFQFTFNEAGTFDYVCEVHEPVGMVGTVTVEA